ncbi:hypothetical protein MBLNU230_g5746t1 [Neophaeotheca triangularis]
MPSFTSVVALVTAIFFASQASAQGCSTFTAVGRYHNAAGIGIANDTISETQICTPTSDNYDQDTESCRLESWGFLTHSMWINSTEFNDPDANSTAIEASLDTFFNSTDFSPDRAIVNGIARNRTFSIPASGNESTASFVRFTPDYNCYLGFFSDCEDNFQEESPNFTLCIPDVDGLDDEGRPVIHGRREVVTTDAESAVEAPSNPNAMPAEGWEAGFSNFRDDDDDGDDDESGSAYGFEPPALAAVGIAWLLAFGMV